MSLFGQKHAPPSNTMHIASASEPGKDFEHPVVYRCYLATAQLTNCVKHLHRFVEQAKFNPGLRPWVDAFDYRFLVFVEQPTKRDALAAAIARHEDLSAACDVALAPRQYRVQILEAHQKWDVTLTMTRFLSPSRHSVRTLDLRDASRRLGGPKPGSQ